MAETDNENSAPDTDPEVGTKPINGIEEEHTYLDHDKPDGIGYWGAVAHMIRVTVGTGILLLPYEMKNLGFMTGTVLLVAVTTLYYHIIHILLDLDSRLRRYLKVSRLTYATIVDAIFAQAPFPVNKLRGSLLIIIYIYYIVPIGKSISLVVISKNIQQLAKYYNTDLNTTATVTALTLILTIFCMFRSLLKILVPFSSTTNIFTFVIALVIVMYSVRYRDTKAAVHPFTDFNFMVLIRGMSIFINAVLATDIMLPLQNDMKEPQNLRGTLGGLNVTGFIIVIFYYGFSLIPYLCYGDAVEENVLSNIPVDDVLILCINIAYSLALFVSYILSFYACLDVVWTSKLQAKLSASKYKYVVEYSIRIGFNALAYGLAVGVSDMALISSVSGILSLLLDVSLMPLLQIMLMFMLDERNYWIIFKNVLLIALSLALFLLSFVDFVNELVKLYKE